MKLNIYKFKYIDYYMGVCCLVSLSWRALFLARRKG